MTDSAPRRRRQESQPTSAGPSARPTDRIEGEYAPFGDVGNPMPLADLVAVRSSLGPITHLDLTSRELVPAHHDLGEVVAEQVQRHLRVKLSALPADRLTQEVRAARTCRAATEVRSRSQEGDPRIQRALRTYIDCLRAWTEGARLARFARDEQSGVVVDGAPVTGEDLAFLLQMETIGCQTGLLRTSQGSVILWHTEEDRTYEGYSRFDRLRLVSFRWVETSPPRVITGFLYPDLLLGPAFGWADDSYVQAVDSFYLDPNSHVSGVPANAITWVCLFLAGECSTSEVVRQLGPVHNGYALARASRSMGSVLADTTEFVDGAFARSELGDNPGSSQFQVNLLSDSARRLVPGREHIESAMLEMLLRRKARAQRALDVVRSHPDSLGCCARLLGSRVAGAVANANPDVKAHFLCELTAHGASRWVGPGPAIRQGREIVPSWFPES